MRTLAVILGMLGVFGTPFFIMAYIFYRIKRNREKRRLFGYAIVAGICSFIISLFLHVGIEQSPEAKAKYEAERQARENEQIERVNNLDNDRRYIFDVKYNELMTEGSMDESTARKKALEYMDAYWAQLEKEKEAASKLASTIQSDSDKKIKSENVLSEEEKHIMKEKFRREYQNCINDKTIAIDVEITDDGVVNMKWNINPNLLLCPPAFFFRAMTFIAYTYSYDRYDFLNENPRGNEVLQYAKYGDSSGLDVNYRAAMKDQLNREQKILTKINKINLRVYAPSKKGVIDVISYSMSAERAKECNLTSAARWNSFAVPELLGGLTDTFSYNNDLEKIIFTECLRLSQILCKLHIVM